MQTDVDMTDLDFIENTLKAKEKKNETKTNTIRKLINKITHDLSKYKYKTLNRTTSYTYLFIDFEI
jgi:hypothetical protein